MDGIQVKYAEYSYGDYQCLEWKVVQRYLHTEQPQIRITLEMNPSTCSPEGGSSFVAKNSWLLGLTIICAFASMLAELQYIIEVSKIITKLRESFDKKDKGGDPMMGESKAKHIENLRRLKEQNSKIGNNPQI